MHLGDGLERRRASCERRAYIERPLRPRTDHPSDLVDEATRLAQALHNLAEEFSQPCQ
jgi:hypothetical protein